jgi:hypothetical protein
VVVLSLASLGVFGWPFWASFLDAAREAGSPAVAETMYRRIYMHMTTLLAAGRLLGLPPGLAGLLQLAGALLAVATVWFAFRRRPVGEAGVDCQIAVLATATFLVSPYTLNYDLLLLMPAVVALYRLGVARGLYPGERVLYLALWLIPTFGMILNRLHVPVMPLLVLWFGVVAWTRLKAAATLKDADAAGR